MEETVAQIRDLYDLARRRSKYISQIALTVTLIISCMLGDSATVRRTSNRQVSLQWTAQHRSRILSSRKEEDEVAEEEDFGKGGLKRSSMNLVRISYLFSIDGIIGRFSV